MKLLPLLGAALGVATLALTGHSFLTRAQDAELPAIPGDLANQPIELLHAQPFTLEQPATHWYRAEQPSYTSGLVLVLHADEDLVTPRQTFEPVLYVGAETAERVNFGRGSGNLVVIVPNLTLEALAQAPIFFGTPELPERVTAAMAARELAAARSAGAAAEGAERVALVAAEPLTAYDDTDLRTSVSSLIETYSPGEAELVQGLRVERLMPR